MTDCMICRIVNREAHAHVIYEDEDAMAFLFDIEPATRGHSLIVPKKHFVDIFDIDPALLGKLAILCKKVAEKMQMALGAEGINLAHNSGSVAGQEVLHFHIHVVPRKRRDELVEVRPPKMEISREELDDLAATLKL